MPAWLGLDIGGANLKAATADGFARQLAFPLWQAPKRLPHAIAGLIADAPATGALAVTMTGELADCYASKAEGVGAIIDAVERARGDRRAIYYSISENGFLTADRAREGWLGVAASNWHALAAAVARRQDGRGLLIDVGSTTTDLIPFEGGAPATDAVTDPDRLLTGQLLYQGVGRTPVCAVVRTLPYRGAECPVAAELFATTADAALLLGHAEASEACETADGRPFTRAFSIARLARMVCADSASFSDADAHAAAAAIVGELTQSLGRAIRRQLDGASPLLDRIVACGAGEWLVVQAVQAMGLRQRVCSLSDLIGEAASTCAPAWAVATLAEEDAS